MNGEPSRRLTHTALAKYPEDYSWYGEYSLVQKHLTVFFARLVRFSQSAYAYRVRLRALEKPAITSNRIVHAILCSPVEFLRKDQSRNYW